MTDTEFRDLILHAVRQVGEHFRRPDEDWLPALHLLAGDGKLKVFVLVFPDKDKDQVPGVIEALFRRERPARASLVLSCWTRMLTLGPLLDLELERLRAFGLRDDPQRAEQLRVQLGDGRHYETWVAPITRFADRPPALGAWAKEETVGEARGFFANLLERGFAACAEDNQSSRDG